MPTGMSIWTFPGDMTDFLRPATDAMTEEGVASGGGEGGWAPGERGRDEEERETVRLLREATTLLMLPFHTPTFFILFLFYFILFWLSVFGRSHSRFGFTSMTSSTVPYLRPESFVSLSNDLPQAEVVNGV